MRLTVDVNYGDAGEFVAAQHPRGQPENKGEFAKKGQGASSTPPKQTKQTKSPTTKSRVPTAGHWQLNDWVSVIPPAEYHAMRVSDEFVETLAKAPQFTGQVYRGGVLSDNELAMFKPGATLTLAKTSSTTTTRSFAEEAALGTDWNRKSRKPGENPTLFRFVKASGADIRRVGAYEYNDEIVLAKGKRFRVLRVAPNRTRLVVGFDTGVAHLIELQEI